MGSRCHGARSDRCLETRRASRHELESARRSWQQTRTTRHGPCECPAAHGLNEAPTQAQSCWEAPHPTLAPHTYTHANYARDSESKVLKFRGKRCGPREEAIAH